MMTDQCIICGGTEFDVEDGAKICLECGGHQVNFIELTNDEDLWEINANRFYKKLSKNYLSDLENENEIQKLDWSTFEIFNIILKSWTDALMQYGASNKFKRAVFTLWICYLQRRGVAFIEKDIGEREEDTQEDKGLEPIHDSQAACVEKIKSGIKGVFSKRDVIHLGGVVFKKKKRKMKKVKKTLEKKTSKLESSVIRTKMKLKNHPIDNKINYTIASKFTENVDDLTTEEESETEEIDETQFDMTPLLSDQEIENLAQVCNDETMKEGLEISSTNVENGKSKSSLETEKEEDFEGAEEEDDILQRNLLYRNIKISQKLLSPYYLNLSKLLGILYLALLITEEDILLMDLLRWCREDYIPFHSAGYLIPEEKGFVASDFIFFNRVLPPAVELRAIAGNLARFMSIQALPLPSYKTVLDKLSDALKLPKSVYDLTMNVIKNLSPRGFNKISIPEVETIVAASLLLVFKVTFGMDDVQEEILSDIADSLNKIFKKEERSLRLFSYRKWHNYMVQLQCWIDQVYPTSWRHGRSKWYKGHVDGRRFSHYFWTKAIWAKKNVEKADNSKNINSRKWEPVLLNYTLGLNKMTLKTALQRKPIFKVYNVPYVDLVKHYVFKGYSNDISEEKEYYLKCGTKLWKTFFGDHVFNWILNRHMIEGEFAQFGKDVEIVAVPISSEKELFKEAKNMMNQRKTNGPVRLIIPNPIETYWVRKDKNQLNDLPSSFRWLLKTLSEVCETHEYDIYKSFKEIETKYFTISNLKLDQALSEEEL